jgi:hypothetical protein
MVRCAHHLSRWFNPMRPPAHVDVLRGFKFVLQVTVGDVMLSTHRSSHPRSGFLKERKKKRDHSTPVL